MMLFVDIVNWRWKDTAFPWHLGFHNMPLPRVAGDGEEEVR